MNSAELLQNQWHTQLRMTLVIQNVLWMWWKVKSCGRFTRAVHIVGSVPLIKLDRRTLDTWMHKRLTEYNQLQEGDVSDTDGEATDCHTDFD